jgi:hypothetical protein
MCKFRILCISQPYWWQLFFDIVKACVNPLFLMSNKLKQDRASDYCQSHSRTGSPVRWPLRANQYLTQVTQQQIIIPIAIYIIVINCIPPSRCISKFTLRNFIVFDFQKSHWHPFTNHHYFFFFGSHTASVIIPSSRSGKV